MGPFWACPLIGGPTSRRGNVRPVRKQRRRVEGGGREGWSGEIFPVTLWTGEFPPRPPGLHGWAGERSIQGPFSCLRFSFFEDRSHLNWLLSGGRSSWRSRSWFLEISPSILLFLGWLMRIAGDELGDIGFGFGDPQADLGGDGIRVYDHS